MLLYVFYIIGKEGRDDCDAFFTLLKRKATVMVTVVYLVCKEGSNDGNFCWQETKQWYGCFLPCWQEGGDMAKKEMMSCCLPYWQGR